MMIIPGIHSFYANHLATMFTKEKLQQFALQPASFWVHRNVSSFFVMNCVSKKKKKSVNILCQSPSYFSFLKSKLTSEQREYYTLFSKIWYCSTTLNNTISGWSYFCTDICFNCKNNLTTGEEVSRENWSFGCSTKLFHKQFQEKKVEDFRKAVTYERNAYCLFALRKWWRLKTSVPSGNIPSTGFHWFPGKWTPGKCFASLGKYHS